MNLTPQGFWLPKAGNSESDYEDAFAIGPAGVAIADGATESSFARAWAMSLTEGFACEPLTTSPDLNELLERVGPLQQRWHEGIAWDRLPWFAEDKARNGAFTALLTLRFEETLTTEGEPDSSTVERRWYAFAIGDTCLFQIREEAMHLAFPLNTAAAFDSTPLLLSSNPARNLHVWEQAEVLNGSFQPGDTLLLMTDALSKWFLTEVEAGNSPWHILNAIRSQEEFAAFVTELRTSHHIKNDDTTLLRIQETGVVPMHDAIPAEPAELSDGDKNETPDALAPTPAEAATEEAI